MKWNGTRLTAGCRHEQGGMGMKIMTALILALAMVLAMFCATAEDSYAGLVLDESVQASDEAITIEDEAAGEDGMDIELADEAILDEDTLAVDGLSLDGLKNNLLSDGLAELESIVEDNSNALADNESNPEDFEIDEDGVLVEYKGKGGDVVIPDGVTAIGDYAFSSCSKLTSVTIPDSVTGIGYRAFALCSSLTSIIISETVTNIGEGAFGECANLEKINVSERNRYYASIDGILYTKDLKTLIQCPGAKTSVTIPNNVTSIGVYAFSRCSSMTSVIIGNNVIDIGEGAFYGCSGMTGVIIGNNVISIGEDAFGYCTNLRSVSIPDSVKALENGTFQDCTNLTTVNIGNGVNSIGGKLVTETEGCFAGCSNLTSITMGKNVIVIGEFAFDACSKLKNITIPDSVTIIEEGAFIECKGLTDITIPNSVTTIGKRVFTNCKNLIRVTIGKGVTSVGEGAFHIEDWGAEDENRYTPLDITIYGYKGTYAETYAKENGFKFSPLSDPISIAKAKITVSSQVYTGKALKPAVTVKYGSKTLKKGTDYTVSYKNNKAIGTATVTVTGKGDYTGTAKKTFKINPKAVSGLKLTAGKGRLTVSWKKGAGGIGGYQLQYGLKKSFSGAKKATVSKASTVKGTIKNLKKGKIYYVRIRAFKKVGKTTYWSAWSAAKKARVK